MDENTAAAEAIRAAHALWRDAGDWVAAAAVVPRLVEIEHLLGEPLEVRAAQLAAAFATLAYDTEPAADQARAPTSSARCQRPTCSTAGSTSPSRTARPAGPWGSRAAMSMSSSTARRRSALCCCSPGDG